MPIALRRTVIAGQYCDDDYTVYEAGLEIGRIMLHRHLPIPEKWAWHINPPVPIPQWCNGRSLTRDAAKEAFHEAWSQFKPTLGNWPALANVAAEAGDIPLSAARTRAGECSEDCGKKAP